MRRVSVSEMSSSVSRCLNIAAFGGERIVVTSRGNPKAAIIGLDDLRKLERLEKKVEVRTAEPS